MSDAIKAAAQGMRYWEQKQAAMANNLANVSTPGFKGEKVFARLLDGQVSGLGVVDQGEGTRQVTDRAMDFALEGDGFFVVETPNGERYTRAGSFSLNAEGVLVDQGGNAVQAGGGGSIVLPPGTVNVTSNGDIEVDGAVVATFKIAAVPQGQNLEREGGVYFLPSTGEVAPEPGSFRVHQGQLEESNVDPMMGLVDMLDVQRNYAALQRTISVADGIEGRIANDIGRIE